MLSPKIYVSDLDGIKKWKVVCNEHGAEFTNFFDSEEEATEYYRDRLEAYENYEGERKRKWKRLVITGKRGD